MVLNDYLGNALDKLASLGVGGNLMLVDLSPLDDLVQELAHVLEFEMRSCLRACVLVVRVVVKVDSFVVHEAAIASRLCPVV